jgi:hypothetical protein
MKDLLRDLKNSINRRSFMRKGLAAGAATVGATLLTDRSYVFGQEGPEEGSGSLTRGDAALLRFASLTFGSNTTNWEESRTVKSPVGLVTRPIRKL